MRRRIPRNKSTAGPGSVVFLAVDTEPTPSHAPPFNESHRLKIGHARYARIEREQLTRRRELTFTERQPFWDWLVDATQLRRPTWVFGHNMGRLLRATNLFALIDSDDFHVADDDFQLDGQQFAPGKKSPWRGFVCCDDPPTIISLKHCTGRRVIFVDAQNFWRVPLEDLADELGIKRTRQPRQNAAHATRARHVERDAELIETAVSGLLKWVKANDLGMFRFTAPAMAFGAWRHRFAPNMPEIHDDESVSFLERQSYFAGRLQLRYHGRYRHELYELDVNSLFPAMMAWNSVPIQLVYSGDALADHDRTPDDMSIYSCAEVLIETDRECYPLRLQEGVYYPQGRYWTCLAGPELDAARQRGHVLKVGRWAEYNLYRAFDDYVHHFYSARLAARDAGDSMTESLCKLLLNSLYGKFAQLTPQWVRHSCDFAMPRWAKWGRTNAQTGQRVEFRSIGSHVQASAARQNARYAFPAISSWITSAAREYMRTIIDAAGPANVLYVVTDAVFVNADGLWNLREAGWIDDRALGKLKQKSYGQRGEFRALNNYSIGNRHVRAGVPAEATPLPGGSAEHLFFERLSRSIADPPRSTIRAERRTIKPAELHHRGRLLDDGRVAPLILDASGPSSLRALRSGQLQSLSDIPAYHHIEPVLTAGVPEHE